MKRQSDDSLTPSRNLIDNSNDPTISMSFVATGGNSSSDDAKSISDAIREAASRNLSTQDEFDRLLALEKHQQSREERQKVLEEIHGIATVVDENDAFVSSKLLELTAAIGRLPKAQRKLYDQVVCSPNQWETSYITSRMLQLQFLRAERYESEASASRMMLFCEKKASLFGQHTVGRGLRISDLAEDELKWFQSGYTQILPQRDRSGRMVLFDTSLNHFCLDNKASPKARDILLKCFWFLLITALEGDGDSQRRGVVVVFWWVNHPLGPDSNGTNGLYEGLAESIKWLPVRPFNSAHICINSNCPVQAANARRLAAELPKAIRLGTTIHIGSKNDEVLARLGTFGIPTDLLPITPSGVTKTKDFQRWIQRRRNKELYSTSQQNTAPYEKYHKIDLVPNDAILFGTGKPIMNHAGNQVFRSLIESRFEEYEKEPESNKAKNSVSWQVVSELKAAGMTFLKRDSDDWWIEVSEKEARDKVLKAFISQRGKNRSKTKRQHVPNESGSTSALNDDGAKMPKRLRHDGYYEEQDRGNT